MDHTRTIVRAPDGLARDAGAATAPERPDAAVMRLEEFFLGPTRGVGVIHDRFGRLANQASADMVGRWDGETFALDEMFRFSDGRVQERVWRVQIGPDGGYRITAPDMVGTGTGNNDGNALDLDYRLQVPVGRRTMTLRFDDRMYLQDDGTVINVNTARKFGLVVARLCFVFRRSE